MADTGMWIDHKQPIDPTQHGISQGVHPMTGGHNQAPHPQPPTDLMGYERGNPDDEKEFQRSRTSVRRAGETADLMTGPSERSGALGAARTIGEMDAAHNIGAGDKGYEPAVQYGGEQAAQSATSNFAAIDAKNAAAGEQLASENAARAAGSNMAPRRTP